MNFPVSPPPSKRKADVAWPTLLIGALLGCSATDSQPTRTVRERVILEGAAHHTSIDVGERHGCVIRSDGNVYCWGANDYRQTDPSDTSGSPVTSLFAATPVALPGGEKAAEVALGERFSCARTQSGSVVCWGSNTEFIHPTGTYGIIAPTAIPVTISSDTVTRTARAPSPRGSATSASSAMTVASCATAPT